VVIGAATFPRVLTSEVSVAFNYATLTGHDWSPVALTPFSGGTPT